MKQSKNRSIIEPATKNLTLFLQSEIFYLSIFNSRLSLNAYKFNPFLSGKLHVFYFPPHELTP